MISSRTRRNIAAASLGALATLLWAHSAAAQQQDARGPLIDGQVFCPSDGAAYPEGIRYDAAGNIILDLGDGLSLAPVVGEAGIIAISGFGTGGAVAINGSGTSISTRDATGAAVEADGDIVIDLASVSTEVVTPGEVAAGITAATPFGSTRINVGSVRTVDRLGPVGAGRVMLRGLPTNRMTQLVRNYVDAADIGKRGSCHLFRHTMATLMLENGADIRFIQAMLGHAELSTTQIYTQVSIRMLKQIHSATHPGRPITAARRQHDAGETRETLFATLDAEADDEEG